MSARAAANAPSLDRRFYGVVVAIVTKNDDPDGLGRVRLRFPWFDNRTESDWCRVAYPNGGAGVGLFAVPERDAEVLVAFEHGNMNRPFVLGGLYNGRDAPPTTRRADDVRDEKLLRTRGGHQLLFRDTVDQTEVRVETSAGEKLTLTDPGRQGGAKVSLETHSGHKVELDDQAKKATVALSGPTAPAVVLDGAAGTVTISAGTSTVTIDGSGYVTVECIGEANVRAPKVGLGPMPVQSLVLGELFMALFNAHVHALPPPLAIVTPATLPPVTPMLPAMLSQIVKTT